MAQNVVGTFATMGDAESAVQALREIGITDDEMTVVPHTSDAADAEATTALAQSAVETAEQEGRQVPEAVAEVAAHGPKREGGYIIVRVGSDDAAARATEIMERYRAVDLESRGQQYEAGEWTHVDDPAALATSDPAATESMAPATTGATSGDFATLSSMNDNPTTLVGGDGDLVNPITDDTTARPGSDAVIPSTTTRVSQIYAASSIGVPSESLFETSGISGTPNSTPDMPVSLPVTPAPSPTSGVSTSASTSWSSGRGLGQQVAQGGEGGWAAFLQRPLSMLLIGVALGFGLAQVFNKERAA